MSERIGIIEASRILGIAPNTVRRLVREGILPAYEVVGVKGVQFKREDVEKLLRPVEPERSTARRKAKLNR